MSADLKELISERNNELILSCFIQVRSSNNSIVGRHGDELKVALTAPPVDGKANAMLIEFFAKQLNISKSRVILRNGLTSRHKQLAFKDVKYDELLQLISK